MRICLLSNSLQSNVSRMPSSRLSTARRDQTLAALQNASETRLMLGPKVAHLPNVITSAFMTLLLLPVVVRASQGISFYRPLHLSHFKCSDRCSKAWLSSKGLATVGWEEMLLMARVLAQNSL